MEFNDRRPHLDIRPEDYETPVTRSSVSDANARLRSAVIAPDREQRAQHINQVTKRRHRDRKRELGEPFQSVGQYLEDMHGHGK